MDRDLIQGFSEKLAGCDLSGNVFFYAVLISDLRMCPKTQKQSQFNMAPISATLILVLLLICGHA